METLSYAQLMERCLAAEAERDAVVAENSGLKSSLTAILQPGEATLSREHRAGAIAAIETPATDSAIAALRAEGVEMFAAFCGEENSVFVEAKAYYRSLPDAAAEFARQLRESKGANHE